MPSRLTILAAIAALLPAAAGAQQLEYQGELSGTGAGLGAVITVLTLNNTGNISSGCIAPIDVTTGCGFANNTVQESSTTVLLSAFGGDFATLGSDLRIIANFSEPAGNTATVEQLELRLYDGGTSIFTAMLSGPVSFPNSNTGVGNVGFAFGLTPTAASEFQAILNALGSTADVRIGLGAELSDVQGGLDTFSLLRVESVSTVPEPGTWALLGTGLLGLGGVASRRRRQTT